jgi:xanthine dehydrogenase YagT iron-sulfur-binding subunit
VESSRAYRVALTVNGERRTASVDPRTSLLDLLRERLGLTGAKKGCDHGQCGACTVLLEGRRVLACLALAVAHDGAAITTVEGLADGGPWPDAASSRGAPAPPRPRLSALQQAFIDHDALQCGYCTPGQLCSATGMLTEAGPSAVTADPREDPPLTPGEIRERMSGNLCRCGAYAGIVSAIGAVAGPPGEAAS